MTREERVQEFIDASRPPSFELVWTCLGEEMLELKEAAMNYASVQDRGDDASDEEYYAVRAEFVKEWADVQYVLSQLACFYKIDGEEAFRRVADNNMTKVVDGKVTYREDGKILKPADYKKPDMTGI